MTGPINPDRYDELCLAERRMKFLEAFAAKHKGVYMRFDGAFLTFADHLDAMMAENPELCEEITEVKANG